MTNHPNRGWRKRWRADLAALSAFHAPSGLTVTFERAQDGGWDGKPAKVPQSLIDNAAKDGGRELARLMREAGDIFYENLAKN